MQVIGILLWLAGLALQIYAAGVYDPSVSSSSFGYGSDRIINMNLQQQQLMMFIGGCAFFVAGVIAHVASAFLPRVASFATENAASTTVQPNIANRMAYARQLGIVETDDGFIADGNRYDSLDGAIAEAEKLRAL